jgi:hypothetical protein
MLKEKEIYILYFSVFNFPFNFEHIKEFEKKEELLKFCEDNPEYSFKKFYKGKKLKMELGE